MKISHLSMLLCCLFLAACNRLTMENYDKLKTGMPYAEVKALLGEPSRCGEVLGIKHCVWGDEQRHIDVSFVGDQAVVFAGENIH